MSFVIQSPCKLITDKVSGINHDFILNHKVLYTILAICLLNYITLNFCEIVISDWKYSVHDFSNFHDRTDLKLFLHCDSLCDIKTKKHVKTEIFVEIKWCYFNKFVNSIVISKFNYWQSADSVILQMVHIKMKLSLNFLIKAFHLIINLKVMKY